MELSQRYFRCGMELEVLKVWDELNTLKLS